MVSAGQTVGIKMDQKWGRGRIHWNSHLSLTVSPFSDTDHLQERLALFTRELPCTWSRIHVGALSHACPTLLQPWTVAHLAPLSTGFSRQEHCSGLPLPPPEDLPDLGIKAASPALQADSLPSESPGKPIQDSEMLRKEIL